MTDEGQTQYRGRDSATLTIIGSFFVLLSLLVLCGNLAGDVDKFTAVARRANLAVGVILLLIGALMTVVARRIKRSGHSPESPDESSP